MRRLAMSVATMGFFALAIIGWLSDVPLEVCAIRAVVGAVVIYVVVSLAGRVAVGIMVDAVVRNASDKGNISDTRK